MGSVGFSLPEERRKPSAQNPEMCRMWARRRFKTSRYVESVAASVA